MPTDFFKVRAWLVIGPPNAGKSSVIGNLISQAGQGAGGCRDILQRGGGWLKMNAFRQSRQEANKTAKDVVERILSNARSIQTQRKIAYYNVLLALRSDVVNNLPTGDKYIEYFIENGWDIQSLVLLNIQPEYDRYALFGAPTCDIPNSIELMEEQLKRNWVFGHVRNHFGWA